MSGFIGNLSASQEATLAQTKQRIESIPDQKMAVYAKNFMDDSMYLRFLRARKFELEPSVNMILAMLKFRMEYQGIGVDALTSAMCPNEIASGKTFVHNIDKEGRPIVVMRGRFHDTSKVDLLEGQRFAVYIMEVCRKILRAPIETVTLVFDMSDVGRKNLDLRFIKYIIDILQNYYPESLGRIYIYNSTWFVQGFWKLVRPLLDPVTAAKVIFVDKKTLVSNVGEGSLMPEFGGSDPFVYNAQTYVQSLDRVMANSGTPAY